MTVSKESYVDFQEKYEKVRKLLEEDSKLDPADEPYLSKYNAKQILIGMKANLETLLSSQTPGVGEHTKLTAMLGTVLLYLGRIAIETEDLPEGEKNLKNCLDTISPMEMDPEMILVALNLLNEFGYFWSRREPKNSKKYLEKAVELYKQFKSSEAIPIDIHYLFQVNPEPDPELSCTNLEKAYTLTLYYSAQIYGALDETLSSSIYCHITLKRQIQLNEYNPIDWALNSATLSQYFMEKNGFKQARHHLAASSYMLDAYKTELDNITEHNDDYDSKMEKFKHRSADIARCWAKYGLLLLSISRDRLMHLSDHTDCPCAMSTDLARLEINSDITMVRENLENLTFDSLNLTKYECQITDKFILTLEDARKVFLNIKIWLEHAHTYYTLQNLASDYIEIVQDQSQMYVYLSFFEESPENQAKMHKRRVDLIEAVLKEINPAYYMRYCRQLWYELAQVYVEILYIKLDKMKESTEKPSAATVSKINSLVDKGILYNNTFINSFKEGDVLPETISDDYVTPFLKAHLSKGSLYSRYIMPNKKVGLQHVQASLECYKKVLDYGEKNPKIKETLPTEYNICTEMTTLLPVKILKLEKEIPAEA